MLTCFSKLRYLAPGFIFLCLIMPQAVAEDVDAGEAKVVAACIYNFAKFVDWPETVDSLDLCVLGASPVTRFLVDFQGSRIQGKPIDVKVYHDARLAGDCEAVFVSESETDNLTTHMQSLQKGRSLTISTTAGFSRQGGIIELYWSDETVAFFIHAENARAGGLDISSKLMRLSGQAPPHSPDGRK